MNSYLESGESLVGSITTLSILSNTTYISKPFISKHHYDLLVVSVTTLIGEHKCSYIRYAMHWFVSVASIHMTHNVIQCREDRLMTTYHSRDKYNSRTIIIKKDENMTNTAHFIYTHLLQHHSLLANPSKINHYL